MGMFDYIQFDADLPVKKQGLLKDACNPFQSKSVATWVEEDLAYEVGCLTLTVNHDGRLINHNGSDLNWSGDLIFYGSGRLVKWAEFKAVFIDGIMQDILVVDVPPRFK